MRRCAFQVFISYHEQFNALYRGLCLLECAEGSDNSEGTTSNFHIVLSSEFRCGQENECANVPERDQLCPRTVFVSGSDFDPLHGQEEEDSDETD